MGPFNTGDTITYFFYILRGTCHFVYMVTSNPLCHQKSGTSVCAVVRGRKEYLEYLRTH